MTPISSIRSVVLVLAASGVILAQQPPVDPQPAPSSNGGWRHVDQAPAAAPAQDQSAPPAEQQQPAPPTRDAYGQQQAPPAAAPAPRPAYGLPAEVTLKPSTFVTMRINQMLASNKSAVGDTFSGSLTQPLVLNGIVVAPRGAMVYGKVAVAEKVKGVHRLGVELTNITLADGSQIAVHTQLVSRQGPTMPGGQQAGIITSTTGVGAIAGGVAGGGAGAGVGAGAGAAAGIIAVLATRNRPSVIYPETALTFQVENSVTIPTGNAAAFRYVGPDDFSHPVTTRVQTAPPARTYVYGPGYYPYYDPFWSPYWGGWGPGLYIGGGFGFRGGFRRW